MLTGDPASETDFDWSDPRRGQLIVRRNRDGGYVAFGLGDGAKVMEDSYGDRPSSSALLRVCRKISTQLADAPQHAPCRWGFPDSVATISDEPLRTLAIAGLLLKAGFNPEEPRDEHGRWTADGDDRNNEYPVDPQDVAYYGDYHNYLVQTYAQIVQTHGGAAVTSVPLTSLGGLTAIADLIVRPHGWPPYAIEIKTGANPAFTPNQALVYALLPVAGHLSTSKDLTSLGLPRSGPLPSMRLLVVYAPKPGAPVQYIWWPPLPDE